MADATTTPLAQLKPVPFTNVRLSDPFFAPRQEVNRQVSIPHSLQMLEKFGNIKDLELAAAGAREGYMGPFFIDSDMYKALEAVSYSLAAHPDAELEKKLDEIIAKIAAAQMPDGYINTHYQVNEPDKRWTNLRDKHELYCAGHLFEAAVAHYQATGKRTLLDIATKFADHIDARFGKGEGKREGYCGHQEIELALIKLWRVTGEGRYFDLANYFTGARGSHFFAREHNVPEKDYDGSYWQDHAPIREQKEILGHAVRALYFLSGATDIASETKDASLVEALERIWRDTVYTKTYVTGGVGSSAHNEGFTTQYDLPNLEAYQETCASIAMAMWNHRMALLTGDPKYVDALETALYNAVPAGVALGGDKFFYVNPLASTGTHHRTEWFGCACCPPNITRTFARIAEYALATGDNSVWINLPVQCSAEIKLTEQPVKLEVTSGYPWNGKAVVTLNPQKPMEFELRIRKPGWCEKMTVDGAAVSADGGYHVIKRAWKAGNQVEVTYDMPVRRVAAHPKVAQCAGKFAFARGPIVYCAEECDNEDAIGDVNLAAVGVAADAQFINESASLLPAAGAESPSAFGAPLVVLKGLAKVASEVEWRNRLYAAPPATRDVPLKLVPYCVWDNREPGEMVVWFPTEPKPVYHPTLESRAKVSMSFVSENCHPEAINNGVDPKSSSDQPRTNCHWWPHKGSEEWVQYTWKEPVRLSGARVYWFDDTGRGECRVPQQWRIEYKDGEGWKPATARRNYDIAKDKWCEVDFADPVETTELRLVVQLQHGFAAGVHEWQVLE